MNQVLRLILQLPWDMPNTLQILQLPVSYFPIRSTHIYFKFLYSVLTFNNLIPNNSRMWMFRNISVLQGGIVSTSPNPQAGGPPLVGCPRLLIQFIRSYPPYRRPFLYPQPEDAPCRGDRDPLHGIIIIIIIIIICIRDFLLTTWSSKRTHVVSRGTSVLSGRTSCDS